MAQEQKKGEKHSFFYLLLVFISAIGISLVMMTSTTTPSIDSNTPSESGAVIKLEFVKPDIPQDKSTGTVGFVLRPPE